MVYNIVKTTRLWKMKKIHKKKHRMQGNQSRMIPLCTFSIFLRKQMNICKMDIENHLGLS